MWPVYPLNDIYHAIQREFPDLVDSVREYPVVLSLTLKMFGEPELWQSISLIDIEKYIRQSIAERKYKALENDDSLEYNIMGEKIPRKRYRKNEKRVIIKLTQSPILEPKQESEFLRWFKESAWFNPYDDINNLQESDSYRDALRAFRRDNISRKPKKRY